MKNLFNEIKIRRELKRFREFKKTYSFEFKEIEERKDGSLVFDDVCIREGKDGDWIGES